MLCYTGDPVEDQSSQLEKDLSWDDLEDSWAVCSSCDECLACHLHVSLFGGTNALEFSGKCKSGQDHLLAAMKNLGCR